MSRASVYYLPRPASESDLALMRRIDALHLEHPFMGARMLRDSLCGERLQHEALKLAHFDDLHLSAFMLGSRHDSAPPEVEGSARRLLEIATCSVSCRERITAALR